jgi:phosphocarrier protein
MTVNPSAKPEFKSASGTALLVNAVGLHARPSVKLTQLAKSFSAVKIMRIKAPKGTTLYFQALGDDCDAAVAALTDLVNRRFDETEDEGHG